MTTSVRPDLKPAIHLSEGGFGTRENPLPVSISVLRNMRQCRRSLMLGTLFGIRSASPFHNTNLGVRTFGTKVHNCLELYYAGFDTTRKPDATLMLAEWEHQCKNDLEEHPGLIDDPGWIKAHKMGKSMLGGYPAWTVEHATDEGWEHTSCEQEVSVTVLIDSLWVRIQGKVDLIATGGPGQEKVWIVDHKTAASFDSYLTGIEGDEQLLIYTWLWFAQQIEESGYTGFGQLRDQVETLIASTPVLPTASMNILRKADATSARTKPPYYARGTVSFSVGQLTSFGHRLGGMVRDYLGLVQSVPGLLAQHAEVERFYPSPGFVCSGCEFKIGCGLLDDTKADVNGFFSNPDKYSQIDPFARYKDDPSD